MTWCAPTAGTTCLYASERMPLSRAKVLALACLAEEAHDDWFSPFGEVAPCPEGLHCCVDRSEDKDGIQGRTQEEVRQGV